MENPDQFLVEIWELLGRAVSLPSVRPKSGRVAAKVVSLLEDEVLGV